MSWDAVGAIAETIGALAVLATLAYLALQIRQNTRSTDSAVLQGMWDNLQALQLALSQDPDLARLVIKANREYESLTPEEALRFGSFASSWFSNWQNFLLRRSFVDEELWQDWDATFRGLLKTPAYQRFWESERGTFPAVFRRHVDGVE